MLASHVIAASWTCMADGLDRQCLNMTTDTLLTALIYFLVLATDGMDCSVACNHVTMAAL